ncbi:type II toxin-antitoxin system PemK/MazF family toxin [Thiomicrorhabdus sp. Kp2]|uniref:type II toxin-antitoxin system PemK/MazF family toxin n=1 Tax=Thiomicrorhabdus sp. Kp2 TaxID=1123518 RepID=UPI0004017F6F|nr:type II toxin-antitoxin system PemK/MazF family toxin [Thiomicrorhabdus sp. Kp2]
MVNRGDVYWVELDPTVGTEIQKIRPCLIVSPDDMNSVLPRVIIAPITSKGQSLGCRPEVIFNGKMARILLDQIRTVDKKRLKSKMGKIELDNWHDTLIQMLS